MNKAHGWDEVSVRMVKICDEILAPPLQIIFQFSSDTGTFPNYWKRGNLTPVQKKGDMWKVGNYRPVSLLPVLGKSFEKSIYDSIYSYFEQNYLFTSCQSGFCKNDSCIYQLLSITHEIYKGFDANPPLDTRGVFLDISKAFDKVWHEGFIFKLQSYGNTGSLLSLLKDFLSDRLKKVWY